MTRFAPLWRQAADSGRRSSSKATPAPVAGASQLARAIFVTFSVCIVIFGASLAIIAAGNPNPKFPPCGKVASGQVSKQGCYNACNVSCRNQTEKNLCFRACDQKFDGEGW